MDFSASNTALWGVMLQMGIIAGILLLANLLRRKLPFVKKSLMPTAVLGGFLLLLLRVSGLVPINLSILEMVTYHGIALGFIAMSLKVPERGGALAGRLDGPKSGALIVSTYVVQGILGLAVSLGLAYTIMPGFFKASGILLPMGYGQGPGQANNIGSTYENLGFAGGRSFGLSIAAAGYLSACVVGVIYLNYLQRKGRISTISGEEISGSVTVETFQNENEIPISESVDKLSVQAAFVLVVYLFSYLAIWGLSSAAGLLGPGVANTISTLLWGFNFIVGSVVAIILRSVMKKLRSVHVINRQYQNNYLLSRISGLAFDVMIIAGIASIEIKDLQGYWLPFLLMTVPGAVVTLWYLQWLCKKVYPNYYYEGLLSMYGMLTGTISSGVLLLREVDPDYKTPAANNLVLGSSFAIIFGAPMLALIGIAPNSSTMTLIVLGLLLAYILLLLLFILKVKGRDKACQPTNKTQGGTDGQ